MTNKDGDQDDESASCSSAILSSVESQSEIIARPKVSRPVRPEFALKKLLPKDTKKVSTKRRSTIKTNFNKYN